MNVLVNLLPDTRQVKLREKRRRQIFGGVAVATWVVCGGVIALMVLYSTSQKLLIANAQGQIDAKTKELKAMTGLPEALTAQQHVESLPGLYSQRVYLTKFFKAYSEANPSEVSLNSLTLDANNQLSVNGTASSYAAATKLAKALEASNVKVGSGAEVGNTAYFSDVNIESASRSNNSVTFTLNAMLATGVTSGN